MWQPPQCLLLFFFLLYAFKLLRHHLGAPILSTENMCFRVASLTLAQRNSFIGTFSSINLLSSLPYGNLHLWVCFLGRKKKKGKKCTEREGIPGFSSAANWSQELEMEIKLKDSKVRHWSPSQTLPSLAKCLLLMPTLSPESVWIQWCSHNLIYQRHSQPRTFL